MMTDMEILQLADKCGVLAIRKHEWDGKKFNHTDDYLDGDGAALIIFAKQMMAQRPWMGLTADEMESLYQQATYMDDTDHIQMLMMAEAKLKEKNDA